MSKWNPSSLTSLSHGLAITISVTRLGDFLHFGQILRPLATISLPKSLTFLGNFCKGVKIYHFSSEIIFGQLLQTFGDFYLVTLDLMGNFLILVNFSMNSNSTFVNFLVT